MDVPYCGNCRFFRRSTPDATDGTCKRFPPVAVGYHLEAGSQSRLNVHWFSPLVDPKGWCGEHQTAPDSPATQ